MPLVLLKEVEKLHKRLIRNLNVFAVKCLKLMFLKDTAVEIGDFAKQTVHVAVPFGFRFGEPLKEEWTEEFFVVSVGTVLLACSQFGLQIVWIVIKETFLLNEVDEHQSVEHDGDVPLLHLCIGDAAEKFEECVVFLFETVIKLFGDPFRVKGCANASGYVDK